MLFRALCDFCVITVLFAFRSDKLQKDFILRYHTSTRLVYLANICQSCYFASYVGGVTMNDFTHRVTRDFPSLSGTTRVNHAVVPIINLILHFSQHLRIISTLIVRSMIFPNSVHRTNFAISTSGTASRVRPV